MIKLIDKNYFKINLLFIVTISVYCMCGLIVPLQFISANKIITASMTLLGVLIATFNLCTKKIFFNVKNIEYLILFFILNIVTCLFVIREGYVANVKNMVVFYIYFFAIYPIFKVISRENSIKLYNVFFIIISFINTVGVVISLVQFLMIKGYRVHDYKGLLIRQGFMESRLFGILASPNYLSIVSLIVIIYLGSILLKVTKNYKIIILVTIFFNFTYVVLSGSRTTLLSLMIVTVVYSIIKFFDRKYYKGVLKIFLAIVVVLFSYKTINFSSDQYLKHYSNEFKQTEEKDKKDLTLERTDTSEENISNNRFAIWKSTLQFVPKKTLLGYSSGNWYEVAKKQDKDAYIVREHYLTHNGYLEILFYNGLLGFLSIAVFFVSFLRSMLKNTIEKKGNGIENKPLQQVLLTAIVILVSNLFLSSTFYGISLLGIILFLAVGYYFNIILVDKEEYVELNETQLKEVELGVMDYIHNICKKEEIKYTLAYGTLLGAVRHKGFIPWDDDIDISLTRKEYDRLYEAIVKDENTQYGVVSYKNNKKYPYPFYRVYDKTTYYENNYINNDLKLGICVDIFPFDAYNDVNKEMTKLDIYRQLSVYTMYGVTNKKNGLKNIFRYLLVLGFRIFSVRKWNEKMNNLASTGSNEEYIDYLMEKKSKNTKIRKNALDNTIKVKFEDREYYISKEYNHILSTIYGKNYMEIPKEEDRIKHDNFKAYKKGGNI